MSLSSLSSDAWEDEMGQAAAWLAYALGSSDPAYQGYLNDAKSYLKAGVPWSMSWSEKRPALLVTRHLRPVSYYILACVGISELSITQ